MNFNSSHQLSEPAPPNGPASRATQLSAVKAEMRALLIEGAISPKTTRLDNNFIEKLRRESKARMGLN
jgi:hypothetical protein